MYLSVCDVICVFIWVLSPCGRIISNKLSIQIFIKECISLCCESPSSFVLDFKSVDGNSGFCMINNWLSVIDK